MDQSMVARFKKAAARQDERLDELARGGNIFEQEEKKKRRDYEALDKKWADEANKEFLLEKDRQQQTNELAKQGLINSGQLANTETVNTGAMARQKLMEDTKRAEDINNYNLGVYKTESSGNVDRFKAQTDRGELDLKNRAFDWQSTQPQKGVLGEQLTAMTAMLNDPETTPLEKQRLRGIMLNSITQQPGGQAQQNISTPAQFGQNAGYDFQQYDKPDIQPSASAVVSSTTATPTIRKQKTLEEQESEWRAKNTSLVGNRLSLFNSPMEAQALLEREKKSSLQRKQEAEEFYKNRFERAARAGY
jgi:hypothetical protein